MTPLVLTLVGDDRAGLVNAVASAVTAHDGNWERSSMGELGGRFAGVAIVTVPDERVDELIAALEPLHGLLDITVDRVGHTAETTGTRRWTLDLLGSDRPGIVSEITAVLAAHDVSIDVFTTETREAPMAAEMLFEAHAELEVPVDANLDTLRRGLEQLADELMVDLDLDPIG